MCFLICCCLKNTVSDEVFGDIKTKRYRKASQYRKSTCGNETCSICLEDFEVEEEIQLAPCNHGYHVHCLSYWLSIKNTCPMCHAVLKKESFKEDTPLLRSYRIDV